MHPEFLTPDEARAILEAADRRYAKLRAEYPHSAHIFPPITDETFRWIMERAFLGELRRTPLLPPLDDDADEDDQAHALGLHRPSRIAFKLHKKINYRAGRKAEYLEEVRWHLRVNGRPPMPERLFWKEDFFDLSRPARGHGR